MNLGCSSSVVGLPDRADGAIRVDRDLVREVYCSSFPGSKQPTEGDLQARRQIRYNFKTLFVRPCTLIWHLGHEHELGR